MSKDEFEKQRLLIQNQYKQLVEESTIANNEKLNQLMESNQKK